MIPRGFGRLRNRIQLQSSTTAKNAVGEDVKTYATYATVWACVRPLSGRELMLAQQLTSEVSHEVTVRYNGSLTVDDRIVWGTRTFDIAAVINPLEGDEYQVLRCTEAL